MGPFRPQRKLVGAGLEIHMLTEPLLFQVKANVGILTINRPKSMNALNLAIISRLENALLELEKPEVRVVIITGAGAAFCAGADLKEVLAGADLPPGEADFLDRISVVFNRIRNLPKPVIAALNGLTMAGGLELAMCGDIILAAKSAKIGDAHANFGVYPGAGGVAILPRIIPLNIAKYLLFSGKTLTAETLMGYGLVNEVVEDKNLMARALEMSELFARKSPLALARMKKVANKTSDMARDDALALEQVELRKHFRSWDIKEGLSAFSEKRTPNFKGQ